MTLPDLYATQNRSSDNESIDSSADSGSGAIATQTSTASQPEPRRADTKTVTTAEATPKKSSEANQPEPDGKVSIVLRLSSSEQGAHDIVQGKVHDLPGQARVIDYYPKYDELDGSECAAPCVSP